MNTWIMIRTMIKEYPRYKGDKGEGYQNLRETLQRGMEKQVSRQVSMG